MDRMVLERKCKQLEEIIAQYLTRTSNGAKQIQQEREENLQLKLELEEQQKKAEEMVLRNAIRIGSKASRMKVRTL
uniref:Uncharacterized protein n=1 Tax=Globodera rostochiensis TaxID=31243 RepID=A0A914H684_GLORO